VKKQEGQQSTTRENRTRTASKNYPNTKNWNNIVKQEDNSTAKQKASTKPVKTA
jgi:hypothetical protein